MFINLKDLKQNIGSTIKLTLNSEPVFVEKEWQGRTFNVFNYRVLMNGNDSELSATDALKRKLDELKVGDDFLLSWEEFTKDGQMRNYWKVVKEDNSGYQNLKQPVSNGVNEFDQKLQESKAAQAVIKTNKEYVSPARNGMLFNQTCEQYRYAKCTWTKEQFVETFNRLSAYLDACEKQPEQPVEVPVEQPVQPKVAPSVAYTADDLPF
jgi:hypothetical protein